MTVVGGPATNEPNPCYLIPDGCALVFFTIDESWLPNGKQDYARIDTGWSTPLHVSQYKLLSQWWSAVTDKSRIGADFLRPDDGDSPCTVVAAAQWNGMVAGTIVSNCAKGIVQAKSCDIKPNNINVSLDVSLGGTAPTVNVNNVALTCTADASVLIETNSGERIPLAGSSDSYALLDWGAGFGKPRTVQARRNVAEKLPLRVQGVGLDLLGAGKFTGSAIVNVSYN
jgi:hypothetical protein